jgi:hypothetical protein
VLPFNRHSMQRRSTREEIGFLADIRPA